MFEKNVFLEYYVKHFSYWKSYQKYWKRACRDSFSWKKIRDSSKLTIFKKLVRSSSGENLIANRIEIHPERIKAILSYSVICFRIISNRSEPIRKKFCISFHENRRKSILLNPIQFEVSMNQTNQNQVFDSNLSKVGIIHIDSDWKSALDQFELGFIWIENLVRIHSD